MKNEIDHCQYCYLHYDNCTCCTTCLAFKKACDCSDDNPTLMSPAYCYKKLYLNYTAVCYVFKNTFKGIDCNFSVTNRQSIKDIDDFVIKNYKREYWPDRLKQEYPI